ncbi:MAG: alpha/beta fold hydrolase [Dehalococcoidia bacterium]|nr:alpha/beta fold hydrolase [Dehalococcoidia bacterium]
MTQQMTDYRQEMRECAEAIGLEPPAIVQPEDRYVDLNGIRFHYLDWGNEHLPHLVLLHGGSLTAHTWDMASLVLRERYHVVAPDQRGHGDTGWTPDGQIGRDNGDLMLEDTKAFIDHLGYDHLVLCGMSMGGMNSIRYASRYPERLDALVIVDIAPVTMQQGLIEMEQFRRETETMRRFEDFLERAVNFNPQRKPAHLKYSLLHSLKQVDDGWTWKQDHRRRPAMEGMSEDEMKAARQQRAEAMWADVKRIEVPTLLMRGEISKILSPEAAADTVAAMSDCEQVVIPRAGHSVQGDNPRGFATELDAFVSKRVPR